MPSELSATSKPVHVKLFIDGERRVSSSGQTYNTYDPYGKLINIVEEASWIDIEDAIETASAAQIAWEKTPISDRRDFLLRAREVWMQPKYQQAVSEMSISQLGPKMDWMFEYYGCMELFKGFAAMSSRVAGETLPSRLPGGLVITQRRAYGVVFLMTPWNHAFVLTIRIICLALITGNTIVFRSSELAPRAGEIVAELLHEAGLPKSVFNLIHVSKENNPTVIPKIIAHKKINLISFTGSTRVGRILAAEAGKNLKEIVLELGGKAAAVVLEDADIKEAARGIAGGAFAVGGQACMVTSRVIVQRAVADELIEELVSITRKLKIGADPDAHINGVRTVQFAERIVGLIKEAKEKGAKVLVGDERNDGPVVQPHLLLGYTPDMKAWKEEIFGPVCGITICDTVDEAIELANNTEYSFTNGLWTKSLKALDWANRIHSGMVIINNSSFHTEFGIRLSGLGGASGYGKNDINNFLQSRTTVIFSEKVPNLLLDNLKL